MKIQVTLKNVYGKQVIYPYCTVASTFASLIQQKTFTHRDLVKIHDLGYTIELVADFANLPVVIGEYEVA